MLSRENKKKSHIINKKARKYPHFPASLPRTFPDKLLYLGKIGAFLGKIGGISGKNPMFLGKIVI